MIGDERLLVKAKNYGIEEGELIKSMGKYYVKGRLGGSTILFTDKPDFLPVSYCVDGKHMSAVLYANNTTLRTFSGHGIDKTDAAYVSSVVYTNSNFLVRSAISSVEKTTKGFKDDVYSKKVIKDNIRKRLEETTGWNTPARTANAISYLWKALEAHDNISLEDGNVIIDSGARIIAEDLYDLCISIRSSARNSKKSASDKDHESDSTPSNPIDFSGLGVKCSESLSGSKDEEAKQPDLSSGKKTEEVKQPDLTSGSKDVAVDAIALYDSIINAKFLYLCEDGTCVKYVDTSSAEINITMSKARTTVSISTLSTLFDIESVLTSKGDAFEKLK